MIIIIITIIIIIIFTINNNKNNNNNNEKNKFWAVCARSLVHNDRRQPMFKHRTHQTFTTLIEGKRAEQATNTSK